MGTDWYACLAVGARHPDVVTKFERERVVTKYNETTGEPYEKTLLEVICKVGDREIDSGFLHDFLEENQLEMILPYHSADVKYGIIGRRVSQTKSNRLGPGGMVRTVGPLVIALLHDTVEKKFKGLGIQAAVETFLVQKASY